MISHCFYNARQETNTTRDTSAISQMSTFILFTNTDAHERRRRRYTSELYNNFRRITSQSKFYEECQLSHANCQGECFTLIILRNHVSVSTFPQSHISVMLRLLGDCHLGARLPRRWCALDYYLKRMMMMMTVLYIHSRVRHHVSWGACHHLLVMCPLTTYEAHLPPFSAPFPHASPFPASSISVISLL